jgi:hypothetical protein
VYRETRPTSSTVHSYGVSTNAKHQTRTPTIYSGRHKESVLDDDDWEILPRFQAKSALALGWIHAFSAGLEYTRTVSVVGNAMIMAKSYVRCMRS